MHPIVSIFKLRPSRTFNLTVYSCIKGHVVFLPYNPAFLLTLLPSLTLAVYDIIRIIWAEQGCSTDLDLWYFILVRKQTLLNVLAWLQINNVLYQNIVINYDMLSSMLDEFIFKSISLRVFVIEDNSFEHKGYGVNLSKSNEENFVISKQYSNFRLMFITWIVKKYISYSQMEDETLREFVAQLFIEQLACKNRKCLEDSLM